MATEIQSWLSGYAAARREAALLRARADVLRMRASAPATPKLDGLPHSSGFDGDRIGGAVGTVDEVEREIAELERRATEIYREIDDAVLMLDGPRAVDWRTLIRLRYIDGCEWPDISFLLFGDKEDFSEKEDTYLRRAFRLHSEALAALEKLRTEERENE